MAAVRYALDSTMTYDGANPFLALPFVGRPERRRILRDVVHNGQGWLLVAELGMGTSALLARLALELPTVESEWSVHVVHVQDLASQSTHFGPADFWSQALALPPGHPLLPGLEACRATEYRRDSLSALFASLAVRRERLVLLVDRFEQLVLLPRLRDVEFLGGLRHHAQQHQGALTVVGASRLDAEFLDARVADIARGSPFFNHLLRYVVGPLHPSRDLPLLLGRGRPLLCDADLAWTAAATGGHPRLVQVLAGALWDAGQQGLVGADRRRSAAVEAFEQTRTSPFAYSWRYWSPGDRQAVLRAAVLGSGAPLPPIPRASPPSPGPLASAMLGSLFSSDELRAVVKDALGHEAARGLPGAVVSDAALCDAAVDLAIRRGELDRLLAAAELLRPSRAPEARALRRRVQAVTGEEPGVAVDLAGLAARGLLDLDGGHPRLRIRMWAWWFADALASVAIGAESLRHWLERNGLPPLAEEATRAFAARLLGLGWNRGATSVIESEL